MNSLLHTPADCKASIAANKLEGAGAALARKSLYNGKPFLMSTALARPQMVTGGFPLPSEYLPLTDPASAAASSAASLASAVTA